MQVFRRALAGVVAGCCVLSIAACGSDSKSNSSGGGGSATQAKADAPPIKVKQKKTIGVVNLVRVAPIEANTDDAIKIATDALGWDLKVIDGAGDPQKILQGAQSLVNQKVDALITTSTESAALRPALLAAKKAGIPTISVNGGTTPSDLFTAQYEEDEDKMARQLVEHIKSTVQDPKLINLQTTAAISGSIRNDAFHSVLPKNAFVAEQQIDQTDPVANTQKALTNALTANPDANAVHATYDTEVAPASATIKSKGSKAKVYSYFNVATTHDLLVDKSSALEAVSDCNLQHTGLVAIDQLVQFFEKDTAIDKDALKKDPLEYRVVTKQQAQDAPPFTNEEVAKPFLDKWAKEYPAS
jgi:ABC-type sugar transport system substrate-binding protein